MMHTEEAAKTKWCPFARHDADYGGSHNRDFKDGPVGRCIASDCMAWRWTDTIDEAIERCAMAENTNPYNPQDPELRERGLSYRRGLCGLARGQP